MKIAEIKLLIITLMRVQHNKTLDSVRKVRGKDNEFTIVWHNPKGKRCETLATYFPEQDTIRVWWKGLFDSTLQMQSIDVIRGYIENGTTYEEYGRVLMTKVELVEKLKKGEIKFDLGGHGNDLHGMIGRMTDDLTRQIIDKHERSVDYANGGNDGKWSDRSERTAEEVDANMRAYFAREAYMDLTKNDWVASPSDMGGYIECSHCGCRHTLIVKDENTIELDPSRHDERIGKVNTKCKYADGLHLTEVEIQVTSDLVVANYFDYPDAPEGKEYSDEYSLQSISGRDGIAKYKAENHNVFYGQMTNTCVTVWINGGRDHVIITEGFIDSQVKLDKLANMGFTQVGEYIDLGVWRWEATDVNTIEKIDGGFEMFKENIKDRSTRFSQINVKHGTWKMNHYFDITPESEDEDELFIYAEMKLIK